MKIIDKVYENETVTSIIIDVSEESSFRTRRPAQFATLMLPQGDGWTEAHPFTISNSPGTDTIMLTIKQLGPFTTRIRTIDIGTPVLCKGPYGTFCSDIHRHPTITALAGGIGITPFLSLLRSLRQTQSPHPPITLVWGNLSTSDVFAAEELTNLSKELGITVLHRISGTPFSPPTIANLKMEPGLLDAQFLKETINLEHSGIYVCGSMGMKSYVLAELLTCGVDTTKVKSEVIQWKPPVKK